MISFIYFVVYLANPKYTFRKSPEVTPLLKEIRTLIKKYASLQGLHEILVILQGPYPPWVR